MPPRRREASPPPPAGPPVGVKRSRSEDRDDAAAPGTALGPPPVGPGGYARGAIMRVRAENFMTYTNIVDFRPGPKLNLIIGPNGAGKSSLVCAICIGLGGHPRLLGRARELHEYVRRGARGGWVELTLAGGPPPGRPLVIRRDLSADNDASTWMIDGRQSTAAAVAAAVANLRIQLDNLCQFLPQDRVADLARLPPTALLRETERALGDPSLHALHADLQAAVQEERAARQSAAAMAAEAAAAVRAQEGGRAEAGRAERVGALQRRADAARGKIAWYKAAAATDDAAEAQAMADRARELLAQAVAGETGRAAATAGAAVAALQTAVQTAAAMHTTAGNRLDRAGRNLRDAIKDGPDALRAEVEAAREVLEAAPAAVAERVSRLATARAAVAAAQAELDALPAEGPTGRGGRDGVDEEARAALAALQAQHTAAMTAEKTAAAEAEAAAAAVAAARSRLDRLAAQARRAGDARTRRTRSLRSTSVAEAVERSGGGGAGPGGPWEGPVWGPLGAELAVADPAAAAALEAAVPFHVLRRFVVTTRADQARLVDLVKAVGEANPVSLCEVGPGGALPPLRAGGVDLAAHGLDAMGVRSLAACVSGPAPVVRALTDEARLGSILLAPAGVDGAAADDISSAAKAARARSVTFPAAPGGGGGGGSAGGGGGGPTFHSFVYSRYSKHASTSIASLNPPSHLGPQAACLQVGGLGRPGSAAAGAEAADGGVGASLEERVAAARAEMSAATARAAAAAAAHSAAAAAQSFEGGRLQAAMRAAATVAEKRGAAQARVAGAARALARVEAGPDPAERAAAAAATLAAAAAAVPEACAALTAAGATYTTAQTTMLAAAARRAELEAAERVAKRVKAGAEAALARLEAMVATTQRQEAASRAAAERATAAATTVTGGPLESWGLAEEAGGLPESVDDLEAAAEAAEAEAAGIAPTDRRALERYRERAALVERLERSAADAARVADAAAATAASLRARWAPALRALLASVDARFRAAMQALGCDGRVALGGDDDPSGDPALARADVSVRFRPGEPMARLDGSRQSGGERSVATILYLVALHAVAVSPFRVVDEINQGMDPVNERAVFELLAREAAGAGAPQVLLLTPKLLPGLPLDDPAVTVLQVVNGPVGPGVGGALGRLEAADLLPPAARAVGVAG